MIPRWMLPVFLKAILKVWWHHNLLLTSVTWWGQSTFMERQKRLSLLKKIMLRNWQSCSIYGTLCLKTSCKNFCDIEVFVILVENILGNDIDESKCWYAFIFFTNIFKHFWKYFTMFYFSLLTPAILEKK
jgi:hypothetical protein